MTVFIPSCIFSRAIYPWNKSKKEDYILFAIVGMGSSLSPHTFTKNSENIPSLSFSLCPYSLGVKD